MRRGRFLVPSSLLPLVLCLPLLSAAQINTGEISGVVRDAQGGVLPGASVAAEHVESGARTQRVTDAQGRYLLPSLRLGTYVMTTDLSGFRRMVRTGITLELGQQLHIDLILDVGGVAEEVTVTGQTLLQPTTAEISDVIDNQQVVQIPLNGRNFLTLARN
jgi:Carboxypeptidase regulatory-like domain